MKKLLLLFAAILMASTGLWAETQNVSYLYPVYNTADDPTSGIKEWKTASVDATVVENASEQVTWNAGWYVVTGTNVTLSKGAICAGHVHLILADGSKLTALGLNDEDNEAYSPGIQVSGSSKLTIYGQTAQSGQLEANGGFDAAGIGGGNRGDGSNITINGGTVTATGGPGAAGIGGGSGGKGFNITINGGMVTANGGGGGAGIGGGGYGSCYDITINGGSVTAIGKSGAGIGGGITGSSSDITINGGTVTATGEGGGYDIGGGKDDNSRTVTINGGAIKAENIQGNIQIYGGIFYFMPEDVWTASGCVVAQNWNEATNGDYPWIVLYLCRILCFTANSSGSTVQLNKVGEPYEATLVYSTTGTTWQPYTFGQSITLANEGGRVYFCNASDDLGKGFSRDFMSNYYQFAMTGSVAASGSVMSLLDNTCWSTTFPYDDGDYTTLEDFNYFVNLFSGCTSLTSAPELPATKLTPYCYMWMFKDCTGLTSAPELPAMALSDWCYGAMFEGCTGLEQAPALPATTMASNCYAAMFRGCTGLTEAPELPAMTLAGGCYSEMFENCTNLETAPTLPATTLELNCYDKMFNGCSKLNLMRVGFTEWTNYTTNNWLNGVASTGTFACPEELDKTQTGASNIPEGWITGPYTFTITANSSDESKGTVSGGGTYANGDKIILTATPVEGCAFKHWSDGTTANPYVFTATKDVTLTATFVTIFNVQASPADENEGSVTGGGKYEEGTEVTLTATPAENYVFEKWSDGTTANPYVFTAMKDVTLTALFKEYTRYITDGTEYTATESKFLPEVIYTRTFDNTNWQALYVPFSIDYEEWSEKFDIAKIRNFIEYDDDDNGTVDRTYLVAIKKASGSTEPNYPYLIRAKEAGTYSLVLKDKTLEAAKTTSIDCRSVENEYTFTGTYAKIADMYDKGYYALAGGVLCKAESAGVALNPQRWYMEVTSRTGSSSTKAQSIQILVDGEEGIESLTDSRRDEGAVVYDLQGRMLSPFKGERGEGPRGINIVNGKKIIK